MTTSIQGSKIAKSGFENEDEIVFKFNNWKADEDAKAWLTIMKYNLDEIETVEAVRIAGFKTDVQVQVSIKLYKVLDVENLQVKLVSNKKGFNQIDKRWVDKYKEMWELSDLIVNILKRYTGEIVPNVEHSIDKRRMKANEFTLIEQKYLLEWIENNQSLIVSDILKGRGKFAAEWMLVIQRSINDFRWTLKSMNFCMNFFGNGDVFITKRGVIKIGKITMQRKGGDGGRSTANMLQFKIDPSLLFD